MNSFLEHNVFHPNVFIHILLTFAHIHPCPLPSPSCPPSFSCFQPPTVNSWKWNHWCKLLGFDFYQVCPAWSPRQRCRRGPAAGLSANIAVGPIQTETLHFLLWIQSCSLPSGGWDRKTGVCHRLHIRILLLIWIFWERVSHSPGWSWIGHPPALASEVLWLSACGTHTWFYVAKFEASLGYRVRSCLKKLKLNSKLELFL